MRVLMISKACVVGAYQRKLEELAACPDIELTVAVPPGWRDERGLTPLERAHTKGYALVVEPLAFNGNFHLHYYPRLNQLMARLRPEVVHIDEEPYNFATWRALTLAKKVGAKALFFSWQNILRRYPFPFSWMEREVLRRADAAIVGNAEAQGVWRAKGFVGPTWVIPQFGVDEEAFSNQPSTFSNQQSATLAPHASASVSNQQFVVGYAGRLVPEKGVDILLRALAQLPKAARLHIRGAGPELPRLRALAAQRRIADRVRFDPLLSSTQMPDYYRALDCLVLPSRTRPNWKEQFGRVLIEAMACGVPVVGSTCGEIPNVIGEAGLIFPEGEASALAAQLAALLDNPAQRAALAQAGRARVLAHFTQRRIAEQTAIVYYALR